MHIMHKRTLPHLPLRARAREAPRVLAQPYFCCSRYASSSASRSSETLRIPCKRCSSRRSLSVQTTTSGERGATVGSVSTCSRAHAVKRCPPSVAPRRSARESTVAPPA
uniref:Uncharacterized protein n=1 Tax=Emiliania huxleyi TaxID=2903 RepID=A0A7S3SQU7_EMIHU